jgi:hypothetical protein
MRFPWRFLPEFLTSHPWVVEAIEWLRLAKELWEQYNSLLILVGLWLVARKLGRERERLEERVDTLSQHVKVATDASDAAIISAKEASETIVAAVAASASSSNRSGPVNGARVPASATPQLLQTDHTNWERVNEIWSELKDRVELTIQSISHKSVRNKYSKMPRRTYRDIITALRKDGVLTPGVAIELLRLDHQYPVLRFKARQVTPQEVETFVEALQKINATRVLPPLPTERLEEVLDIGAQGQEDSAVPVDEVVTAEQLPAAARATS